MALQLENTDKRDVLIAVEKKYQQKWQDEHVFEMDNPTSDDLEGLTPEQIREKYPKFMSTMAYPYMNGSGHSGHLFTVSKVEFMTGFQRMNGRRALFPLAWHCTGMPIRSAADKLQGDVARFGQNFERYEDEEGPAKLNGEIIAPVQGLNKKEDITKFSSNKSKANAKSVKTNYQFQSMLAMGIPKDEIHKFADPQYWLHYFPPIWKKDMNSFGARIDWRRQFVTTDANPYYDAFVRWQMNKLKAQEKIKYGKRYTIYSPKDGQPCMDHDRAKGEGVGPTEYTALRLKVKEWSPEAQRLIAGDIEDDANVYFVPATLRPETMYGQTCCFVGPNIAYGLFKVSEKEYYVCTQRAAWNMSFQGTFFDMDNFPRDQHQLQPTVEMKGSSLVGTLVNAPLSVHTEGVRILPMETVLATKGTGVVTCVPSDSPDDYATIRELAKKADYYKIQKEWAEKEIVPVLETPAYGKLTAKTLVEQMKINSSKDEKQLAEAKDLAYKEGFYNGTMLVGDFKGEKVSEAKEKVRQQLIQSGDAFRYADPSAEVISRSADECVVADIPQWYLNYGENDPEWQNTVLKYVKDKDGLTTYIQDTENQFVAVLEWLNQWACARTYGLGSKLPWDPQFLVESLSDSTVYMSYYTIAHFLHSEKFGQEPGILNIKPEQMTDEVWDYVFCRTNNLEETSSISKISTSDLTKMRQSFQYWYPLDLRSSGKDLIPNHLTFFLYIHIALFPQEYWPRSVRANGHLLLNGEKMSKSTGNFLTITQAVAKFGADATRIALADAGDGLEDANFEESGANAAIMRMYTLKRWIEETVADKSLRQTTDKNVLWDGLFLDNMHALVHETYQHYSNTDYKLALKSGLYDFQSARDFYREACSNAGVAMSLPLIKTYIELQALMVCVIAPHWADYMWQEILHKPSTIQNALWPVVPMADAALTTQREYIKNTSSNITSAEAAAAKKMAKGKGSGFDPRQPKRLSIFAAKTFPPWQEKYIDLLRQAFEDHTIHDDKAINGQVAKAAGKEMKKVMPFVQDLRRKVQGAEGKHALERGILFDEEDTLRQMVPGLKKQTGCKEVNIVLVDDQSKDLPSIAENAVPGKPSFYFENIAA